MAKQQLLVLVINLDRSPERLDNMAQRLANFPYSWEKLSAVDGKQFSSLDIPEVDIQGYQQWHGKNLIAGEVGCYLSHIKAMNYFISGEASHLLILEDDALPTADFATVVQSLISHSDNWDMVKLSGVHSGTPMPVLDLGSGYHLSIPFSRHCNTAALLLNRATAKVMVSKMLPMRLPYDHALERPWSYGKRLHIVSPAPCLAGDDTGSTIAGSHSDKFVWHKRLSTHRFRLGNEIRRFTWACGQWLNRPR